MSTINVTNLSGRNGSPNLPDGAVVTGVVTSTTFDGNLKSTGTPTLGLGVTINSSGLHISGVTTVGVVTGGTYYGSGSNLTGVGESIAPWYYNPDVNDTSIHMDTGIGITFNKKVVAGSGTATLKIVNAGVAGTTIQSWGVSSCTFAITDLTFGALVSNLSVNQTYQLDIPGTFIDDPAGNSYVGTAWTFTSPPPEAKLFSWGYGGFGMPGQNNTTQYSSPVQIPGTTWTLGPAQEARGRNNTAVTRTDGTLWTWGQNQGGYTGQNNRTTYTSPKQVGSDTTWASGIISGSYYGTTIITKTDGTLWGFGTQAYGELAQNNVTAYSSAVQIGSDTTWPKTDSRHIGSGFYYNTAIKTDGTLWMWGINTNGNLGQNNKTNYSSPVQVPGTNWSSIVSGGRYHMGAVKTDGTLWMWGYNNIGQLGNNNSGGSDASRSSPIQIPGTTWSHGSSGTEGTLMIKTDNTLWGWGDNEFGYLGQNNETNVSSPVQIPGTTWSEVTSGHYFAGAIKTDGTVWSWGKNDKGQLGQNDIVYKSSPVQVGTDVEWQKLVSGDNYMMATISDTTP